MPTPKLPATTAAPAVTPIAPKAPTLAKGRPTLAVPASGRGTPKAQHVPKVFKVAEWCADKEGEKIVIHAKSGMGKTTLASQIEGVVFIGVDDGGRKITNPLTGKPTKVIPGVESFQDIRDALNQNSLWDDGCTIAIDTLTKAEELSEAYILQNYQTKNGRATNMRQFGWDASSHYLDTMRLLIGDLDPHIRKGHNVVLLCQAGQVRIPNAEGADYLEDGPRLSHNNQNSSRAFVCEWADHVFRIGYNGMSVNVQEGAKAGKLELAEGATRAIFTGGAPHFIAKSRPTKFGTCIPFIVDFSTPQTDDLWQFLFHGAKVE